MVECPLGRVTFETYAHSMLTRVLVTEVHLERGDGAEGEILFVREDLSGTEGEDCEWEVIQEDQAPL